MINLNRFNIEEEIILPIISGWGVTEQKRKITLLEPINDGWYTITLGETIKIKKRASPLEIKKLLLAKQKYLAYPLGNEIVPVNFANFTRESFPVYFLTLRPFEVAEIIQWDDNRYYYYGKNIRYQQKLLSQLRTRFENNETIEGIKGITPELRYYFLILSLQRESYRELKQLEQYQLTKKEKEKRLKQFKSTFRERLSDIITKAGGVLIRYTKSGNNYTVHWRVGGQQIKSTLSDSMEILSLGFCASGYDKEHTMQSAVQLAQLYQERSPLFITRT